MSIHQLTRERLSAIPEAKKSLKPGQIIQGKILELYPKNKARIQIGMHNMVAQLEASLSIGERYHLQVQSSGKFIHLRVLGDRLATEEHTNLAKLIYFLGIKANRVEKNFVQTLINEKIPFDKGNLEKAFELTKRFGKSGKAQQIIKQMVASKLPLTSSVFSALYANSTAKVSQEMKALLSELRRNDTTTPVKQRLAEQLSQLVERPIHLENVLSRQIMAQSINSQQQLFTILQNIGLINKQVNYLTWISKLRTYIDQTNSVQTPHLTSPPSFFMSEVDNRHAMQQVLTNQVTLQNVSSLLLQRWESVIQQGAIKDSSISPQNLAQFKQIISENLLPLLNEKHGQHVQSLLNNSIQINQLLALLKAFSNEDLFAKINKVLNNVQIEEVFFNASIKDQFLSQMKRFLLFSGLTYEHSFMQNTVQGEHINSIKSALIQLTQGDLVVTDRAQQLLHLINGLQLQSVHETGSFIQASMLIPGEKLNLNSDLYLDFESKKTANGEINTDYCRILFYLDLDHLKETIIDMNIQKRLVTVTVFSDSERGQDYPSHFQQILKENLLSIDYQLVTLTFKELRQLHVKSENALIRQSRKNSNSYEGFDYHV